MRIPTNPHILPSVRSRHGQIPAQRQLIDRNSLLARRGWLQQVPQRLCERQPVGRGEDHRRAETARRAGADIFADRYTRTHEVMFCQYRRCGQLVGEGRSANNDKSED